MNLNYDASTITNQYYPPPSCSTNFAPPPGYPPLNAGYTPNVNYPQLYQQPQYSNVNYGYYPGQSMVTGYGNNGQSTSGYQEFNGMYSAANQFA
uniref:Uncharacterized protein n=1 Tax=Caenorhabditis japonica TaxID=281687 RepID=A0A8R1EN33_CAEJA